MTLNRSLLLFACLFAIEGCASKYVIKPGDTLDTAFQKASLLFEKKRYAEAAAAFETVLSMGRGTATAEQAQMLLAESYFKNEELLLAAAEYERFAANYPKSEQAEVAEYKEALCYFDMSPRYKLDQQESSKAIDKFQLYLARYPDNTHTDSVVVMLDDLRNKLGRKFFEAGRLYMTMKHYHAAAIYFGLTMDKYPESKFAEIALAEQVHAYLLFAVNSVADKQEERFNLAVSSYEKYVQIFPDGRNRQKVEKWFDDAKVELARLKREQDPAQRNSGIFSN